MAQINVSYKQLIPVPTDGNLNFDTIQKRVSEIMNFMDASDIVVFEEDGVRCSTEAELLEAVRNYLANKLNPDKE